MTQLKPNQRQLAALQQMGITTYVVSQKPIELALISDDQAILGSALIQDVLRALQLSQDDCVVVASAEGVKAKRYWQFKHYLPVTKTHLHSADLAVLQHDPHAKRRLWQGVQRWLSI
ncbi:DNA polymerase III subunit psi [Ferrimonas pelagia]|uniref:DNA polymerase III subunit psi n=1 Tax=Ferrimonas pelagia TaxID=1177826 RepID=A0ABP9F1A7_9GAMM